MSSTKRQKNRRDNLFDQHPYCYWCDCKLVHPKKFLNRGQTQPDNMATIDHLRNRLDFNRTEPNTEQIARTVLSCKKCNEERGNGAVKKLSIWELWKRSGRVPISELEKENE